MDENPLAVNGERRRNAAQKQLDRAVSKELARASFLRMMKLVYPHRRRMTLGIILSIFAAMTYASSFAAAVPVLKVLVEGASIREWLLKHGAPSPADVAADADGRRRVEIADADEARPKQVSRSAGNDKQKWYAPYATRLARFLPAEETDASRMHTLLILLGALLAINLVGNLCRVFSQYFILYSSHRVIMDLRRRMYRKTLHVPMDRIAGESSGFIAQFLADAREVYLGISTLFGKVVREPFKAICVFFVALWINTQLTLAVLAIAPVTVGVLWYFGRQIRRANTRMLQGYGVMLGGLEETLQGIDVVKGYVREGYERKRMWRLERAMMKQQLKMVWIEAVTSPLLEVVGLMISSAAIVWLASLTFAGRMDSSQFITMVLLLAAMLDPVRKIANVYNVVQRSGAAATRIFDFLDKPDELAEHGKRALPPGPHEVRVENVTFRYFPAQNPPALDDVSLQVRPGECVAFVGPNGSGKSTFVKLLPRLLLPHSGRVLINGLDVNALSLQKLRREIAIVSQRPVIFARTVRENIAYADADATLDQIRDAARKAFAAEFIERWPEQYDTVLGEFGASISGGQRQRIAIARAFLKKASILIFDEATSEIDAESERKIHDALHELRAGKTTFLIAHRHTVMDMADRIVVMDSGRITDVGTKSELVQRCPLFVALYRSPAAS